MRISDWSSDVCSSDLPATVTTWFGGQGSGGFQLTLQRISQALSPGEPLYLLLFAGLITGFTFFYTALVINSQETADNLKKSGALIPGIRPGKATADYVDSVRSDKGREGKECVR